jgi:hypothetical protein
MAKGKGISQAAAHAGGLEAAPAAPGEKPEGWEKLRRWGDPRGVQSGFDPKSRRQYTVGRAGEILWEDVPEGCRFTSEGVLEAKPAPAAPAAPEKPTAPAAGTQATAAPAAGQEG